MKETINRGLSGIIREALLDQFKAREIELMDTRANTFLEGTALDKPYPTFVLVSGTRTFALLWETTDTGKKLYFPITEPAVKYFEYINPDEFDVIFLGTLGELQKSALVKNFKTISVGGEKDLIALLSFNHAMYDSEGEPMHNKVFPCAVIIRVMAGKLLYPKTYINSTWNPQLWPLRCPAIHILPVMSDDPCFQD